MRGGFRRFDPKPEKKPGPVTPVSDRFERWVAPRWIMVQLAVLGAVGAPWILVALFGLRWGWLSLAVLPVAVYLYLVAVDFRDEVELADAGE